MKTNAGKMELEISTRSGDFICRFDSNEPDKGYTVTSSILKGFVTYGDSLAKAKRMAREGIEFYYASSSMLELQREIRDFLQKRKWWPPAPANAAKSIMIEAAELLELFQWSHPSIPKLKKDAQKMKAIQEELADVLIYGLQMAESLGLDSAAIVRAKMKNNEQKYPADVVKSDSNAYWKLKAEHRAAKKLELC